MARKKEIISIRHVHGTKDIWTVKYTGADGLIYWKNIKAEDELAAYLKFIGGDG
jgi:hypothetical protein